MRIIAGAKRGMKLFGPETDLSRPITDRVKESLFSVLYKYGLPDDGKIAADLFCGVGSLGLEALSRGAEFVTFVEKNRNIIVTLQENIEKAGFAGESKIIRADAFKIGAPVDEQKYDLVFVDPPYSTTRETKEGSPLSKLIVLLTEQLSPDGIVVVRTEKRTELLEQYGQLGVIERRQWGTMAVTILRKKKIVNE
jgi:16S rRNA (guanine(966)-N(2))-methyltransferase RsmD